MIEVDVVGGLVGGATVGLAGARAWARGRRAYVRVVVEPYRSDRLAVEALVSAFASLHALVSVRGTRRILTGQPSIALEIHHQVRATGAPVAWLGVCAPSGLAGQVGAVIRGAYPNCRLRRVTSSVAPGGPIVRLHKRRAFGEPVRRVEDVDPDRPPVERLLRAMGAAGGWSVVQIALTPAPLAIRRLVGRSGRRVNRSAGEAEPVEIGEPRLAGPFFGADFRLLGQRVGQLTGIAAELRTGRAPNRLVGRRARGRRRMWAGRVQRGEANVIPTVVRATYAAEELAALWQLPSPGFAAVPVVRCSTPVAPAPAGIRRARPGAGLLADEHGPVTIHADLRRQNTAVVGTVEQGKTSYLVASVREDLRRDDCAVIVLDPKGDAADAALSVVPDGRVCTLLDMARPTCGFNPLAVDAPVDAIADYVVAGLRQLFADGEVRGSSDRYLRNAVIAALAYDRSCSLWDVSRLLEVGAEGTAARSIVVDRLVGVPEFAEVASFLAERPATASSRRAGRSPSTVDSNGVSGRPPTGSVARRSRSSPTASSSSTAASRSRIPSSRRLPSATGMGSSSDGSRRPAPGARTGERPGAAADEAPPAPRRLSHRMPVETQAVGKTFPPMVYAVGREKIREYASAVGETNPLHLDLVAARTAGHADLVAPPMFAVVYGLPAVGVALFDPDVAVDFAMLVHGGQEFEWGPLVVAGDEISTTVSVKSIAERGELAFYVFESVSENQRGEQVCKGTWTNIVRGV